MTFSDFSITVSQYIFYLNWKKVQFVYFYTTSSAQLFLLFNRRLRIRSFGRCGDCYKLSDMTTNYIVEVVQK